MNRVDLLYLLPYLGSLTLSAWILTYTWRHRQAAGAQAYLWYTLGQTLWIAGFIFEMIGVTLSQKLFWDAFQWVSTVIVLVAFPVFAVTYIEHKLQKPWLLFWLSLIVPTIFVLLIVTSGLHQWVYANPQVVETSQFPELLYSFTPVVYAYSLYNTLIVIWGMSLLIRHFVRAPVLYRAQVAVIILGFLIPLAGSALTLLGISFSPQRDGAPFSIALGNIVIAWGLYRFRIFEVIPYGRDKVFETMADAVVILDNQNRILDINRSMLDLLGKKANTVIGQPAEIVFEKFPIPIKLYTRTAQARKDVSFERNGQTVSYELTVWPLSNSRGQMTSRLFMVHDITELKKLEGKLRTLNQELENRVQDRTKELAEAYDTTLEGWAKALEYRDKETEGHSRRVIEITVTLAKSLEVNEADIVHIRRGAILHDIGKMAIPDEILRKRGPLTTSERAIVQNHPEAARKMLEGISFLQKAIDIPYYHHEKWDGTGYPRGLRGSQIPFAARIFAVTDVWDALLSNRPYSKPWTKEQAIAYLKEQSGKHFDPGIVGVFLGLVERGEI